MINSTLVKNKKVVNEVVVTSDTQITQAEPLLPTGDNVGDYDSQANNNPYIKDVSVVEPHNASVDNIGLPIVEPTNKPLDKWSLFVSLIADPEIQKVLQSAQEKADRQSIIDTVGPQANNPIRDVILNDLANKVVEDLAPKPCGCNQNLAVDDQLPRVPSRYIPEHVAIFNALSSSISDIATKLNQDDAYKDQYNQLILATNQLKMLSSLV